MLLLNPNTAVEQLRSAGKIQQALYARFIDRVNEIGAQRDIAAIREYWEEQKAAEAEKATPPPGKRKRVALK